MGVQRGHVLIEPKTRAEFDRMKGALKGAWVLISGKSDGSPIDWSAKGDSIRAKVIAYNDSLANASRGSRMGGPGGPPPGILPQATNPNLKDEPALFFREMREAGILGVIQSASSTDKGSV